MSSAPQGRGGGRGRGGDRGGSRGGDRGGARGGRGDSSVGSRGDSSGGRGRGDGQVGRGRGDYQGGRGRGEGQGARGRGEYQGGGGRGVPRGGQQQMPYRPAADQGPRDPEPGVFLATQQPPAPSAKIIQAEDAVIPKIKGRLVDDFPSRPGYGTQGEKITLRVNCFELIANMDLPGNKKDVSLYKYNVSFVGELSATQRNKIITAILAQAPFTDNDMHWASDYANIIVTTKEIPNAGQKRTVEVRNPQEDYPSDGGSQQALQRRTKEYKLEYEDTFNLRGLVTYLRNASAGGIYQGRADVIQLLNIIVNKYAADTMGIVRVGQNKFYPAPGHPMVVGRDLGDGLKALRGYFSSVRTSVDRIFINVNVAHAAFYNDCALRQLVQDFNRGYIPTADDMASVAVVEPFVYMVKVETKYMKPRDAEGKVVPNSQALRKFKTIAGFAKESDPKTKRLVRYLDATQATFKTVNGSGQEQQTTVANYFRAHHGINLQYPKEPVLNVGTRSDPQYLPMELAIRVLPGQPVRRLLAGNQTSTMIRFAARPPNANAQSIQGLAQDGPGLELFKMRNADKQQWQQPFGFEIKPDMITVPARILPSPKVSYDKKTADVRFGTWNLVDRDGGHYKFLKAGSFKKWGTIVIKQANTYNPDVPPQIINDFGAELRSYGINMGQKLDARDITLADWKRQSNRATVNKTLDETFSRAKNAGISIMLVVLRDKDQWLYSRIKFYGDIKYGVHTVNVAGENLLKQKNQGMLYGNLALKFNIKGGGINHYIPKQTLAKPSVFDERTILFGIDVTHPSPGSAEGAPSIAGVVANYDQFLCQWPASIRAQEGRKEMVTELGDMIKERFKTWDKYNKQRPNKVIVYRDGVSEGQYEQVLDKEKGAFDKVFKELYGEQKNWPKLGIIIVGKRHHIRAYPTQQKDADRTFNCKPGTIIDRGITHLTRHDFYLQSHAVLQGTGRAAHYEVIKDDIGFGADDLQGFTHKMCHLFNRATKAVSVCPPAYYADLLCERGRAYLYSTLAENRTATSSAYDPNEWRSGVHADLGDSTFYI